MTKKENIIELLKQSLPNLNKKYYVKKIGLFGSYAKGTYGKNSDIDIIIEFEKPIGLKFMQLFEYLENLLETKIDILTPAGINSIRYKSVSENIRRSIIYV